MTEEQNVKELRTIEDILADLKGLGIEEFEEILTFEVSGKKVRMRISNIPTEEEVLSLLASEEYKGHMWVQRVRCEILSRAISWLDGVSIKGDEYVKHPFKKDRLTREPIEVNIRIALRDIIMTWGSEVTLVLWKILMVHNQKLEDRLTESFPDSTIFTEVERRFMQRVSEEIESVEAKANSDLTEAIEKEVED